MLVAIIGENCSGKSTLADAIHAALGLEIAAGRDYLRMARSEAEARTRFRARLARAVDGEGLVYVISEPELLSLLPDGAVRVLVTADLDTIKRRFSARMRGSLPAPVAAMLEKKHGLYDGVACDYRYDGVNGDPAALCAALRERAAGKTEGETQSDII